MQEGFFIFRHNQFLREMDLLQHLQSLADYTDIAADMRICRYRDTLPQLSTTLCDPPATGIDPAVREMKTVFIDLDRLLEFLRGKDDLIYVYVKSCPADMAKHKDLRLPERIQVHLRILSLRHVPGEFLPMDAGDHVVQIPGHHAVQVRLLSFFVGTSVNPLLQQDILSEQIPFRIDDIRLHTAKDRDPGPGSRPVLDAEEVLIILAASNRIFAIRLNWIHSSSSPMKADTTLQRDLKWSAVTTKKQHPRTGHSPTGTAATAGHGAAAGNMVQVRVT